MMFLRCVRVHHKLCQAVCDNPIPHSLWKLELKSENIIKVKTDYQPSKRLRGLINEGCGAAWGWFHCCRTRIPARPSTAALSNLDSIWVIDSAALGLTSRSNLCSSPAPLRIDSAGQLWLL